MFYTNEPGKPCIELTKEFMFLPLYVTKSIEKKINK